MVEHYRDDWLTIHGGDCREVLREMAAESVHCVVTSPPYWGLRDYGTATWDGGDADCDHAFKSDAGATTIRKTQTCQQGHPHRDCHCGARRIDSQLGLEATPEEYVAAMVDVFREVRRVLRADGTVWLNLGDSYSGNGHGDTYGGFNERYRGIASSSDEQAEIGREMSDVRNRPVQRMPRSAEDHGNGLKPKDLVGIPWRVAFALQADGWYLRSDIIWSKPNPMPESVTDRPTKSHEYLFLLAKSARYYFDADAVRENGTGRDPGNIDHKYAPMGGTKAGLAAIGPTTARNIRSVWIIATAPYPGAHFATFPPKLVEPCIKAGCPQDGVVLDPFAGTGTVGMVAQNLSRRAVLIDLNPEYLKQCLARNAAIPLGLETA